MRPVPRIYDYQRVGEPIAPLPVTVLDVIGHLKLDPELATAGSVTDSTTYPVADQDGNNLSFVVDGGDVQTVTFSGATTSAVSVSAAILAQVSGVRTSVVNGQAFVESKTVGPSSSIQIVDGTSDLTWDDHIAGDGNELFILEVETLIRAAITSGELYTKRTFQESNFVGYLDSFLTGRTAYQVRKTPLQSITEISYLVGGVETVFESANQLIIQSPDFSRVQPIIGSDWPSTVDNQMHAAELQFVAGYKENEFPPALKLALLTHISALWAQRGDCTSSGGMQFGVDVATTSAVPTVAKMTYSQYRINDLRVGI